MQEGPAPSNNVYYPRDTSTPRGTSDCPPPRRAPRSSTLVTASRLRCCWGACNRRKPPNQFGWRCTCAGAALRSTDGIDGSVTQGNPFLTLYERLEPPSSAGAQRGRFCTTQSGLAALLRGSIREGERLPTQSGHGAFQRVRTTTHGSTCSVRASLHPHLADVALLRLAATSKLSSPPGTQETRGRGWRTYHRPRRSNATAHPTVWCGWVPFTRVALCSGVEGER